MSKDHGAFVWHELMTTDIVAAKAFYCDVLGWTCRDSEMPGSPYWIFNAGDGMVGGLMPVPDEAKKMGASPMWSGYINVDDVDAAATRVKHLGGAVYRAPDDIPGVGRFSVVADPQGAVFELFKPIDPMPAERPGNDAPGRVGWNELYATDIATVFPFYADLFGWTKGEAMNMGPMGVYQMFNHGEKTVGGMMNKPANIAKPGWNFYFNVADIDAAVERVAKGGGKIVHGPEQVPGGQWIVMGFDPQNALFALVGSRP